MGTAALRRSRSYHARQQQQKDLDAAISASAAFSASAPITTAAAAAAAAATSIPQPPNATRSVYQSRAGLIMVHVTLVPIMVASAAAALLFARHFSHAPVSTVAAVWAVVLPFYACVWLSWIYPFYVSELRHVPTVPGFPLWGHVFTLVTEECGAAQLRWHREHGPIVRYFFPLGAERLSIAGDDALRHVLHRNPYNYPKPLRVRQWMSRVLGNGILLAEGAEHVHQRRVLAPGFSTASIRALTPVFWDKALLMAKGWDDEIRVSSSGNSKSKSIEVLDWLNRCTLDIIGQAMFGYDIDSLRLPETPLRQAYRLVFAFDMSSRILHVVNAFIPSSRYLPNKMNRDIETSRNIILSKASDIIHSKQADLEREKDKDDECDSPGGTAKGKDIIALIARGNRKLEADGQTCLSFETMRDQIMTFLGAGHDTTAASVSWTLHILSKNQDIQTRLREEIKQHIPALFERDDNDVDRMTKIASVLATTDPDQLPYLHNVCRESLRWLPPIPLTVRQSLHPDSFSGYHIPAGTPVYIFPAVVNRLEQYWGPTADRFDPDRWEHISSYYTSTCSSSTAYMTFLQGPRGCIGRKFAETEMKVLLCVLLAAFEFSRDETRPDPEEGKLWRLVVRPKDGMNIKVTRI